MKTVRPTASLELDLRKQKITGKYPVKLLIYCSYQKKRYSTRIDLNKEEWEKINREKLRDENLKEIRTKLNGIRSRAENVLSELQHFSFTLFEQAFFKTKAITQDISLQYWFDKYISELKTKEQVGTAISYQTTINSLVSFQPRLTIYDVTPEFLLKYEDYMAKKGKSPSTIGIYLRQLRAVINQAIVAGILKQEDYPFKKYKIPASRNVKKALTDEQLHKLLAHEPSDEKQAKALDYWVFSYLCNGMNFTDIANLKPTNVNGNFLHFYRAKTIRTKKKDLTPIKVALHKRALEIITRRGTNNGTYLFPILEEGLTAIQAKYRIQKFIKKTNLHMNEIAADLGFESKCNTYHGRHSFSSRLVRKNVPIAYIKESLGHSTLAVTEAYIGSFEDAAKIQFNNLLID
jgi:integrase/recombinase XerD